MKLTPHQRYSLPDLNKRLSIENTNKNSNHSFYGPLDSFGKLHGLHTLRHIQLNSKDFWLESEPLDEGISKGTISMIDAPSTFEGRSMRNRISAASKYFSKKVVNMAMSSTISSTVHPNSFCDGCGMDPIVGSLWTCSKCSNINLCNTCYRSGIHGFEESQVLASIRVDFVIKSLVNLCKNRVSEKEFRLLYKDICNDQIDKFKFLANWIVGVILGYDIKKLSVRGIEIPNLTEGVRTTLIKSLVSSLCENSKYEVSMEWFSENPKNESYDIPELQTLRLWVSNEHENKYPFSNMVKNSPSPNNHEVDTGSQTSSSSDHSNISTSLKEIDHEQPEDSSSPLSTPPIEKSNPELGDSSTPPPTPMPPIEDVDYNSNKIDKEVYSSSDEPEESFTHVSIPKKEECNHIVKPHLSPKDVIANINTPPQSLKDRSDRPLSPQPNKDYSPC